MDIQDDLGDVILRTSRCKSDFDTYIAGLLGVSPCAADGSTRTFGTFPSIPCSWKSWWSSQEIGVLSDILGI